MKSKMTQMMAFHTPTGRCQAQSTRTYRRCENGVASGGRFCRLHQTEALTRANAGRGTPRKTSGYFRHLTRSGQEMFRDSLGDLSVLEELAMVRALLNDILERRRETLDLEEFLLTVPYGGNLGQDADGDLAPVPSEEEIAAEKIRRNRKANADDFEIITTCERLVRVAVNAHEMLAGRRVQVSFGGVEVEEEVRRAIENFSKELFAWLPGILCVTCRERLSEELLAGQRTEIVSG